MTDLTDFVEPAGLFRDKHQEVISLMATHSPFPGAQSNAFSPTAKLRAAQIHLEETVFFAQIVQQTLQPIRTVEVCAGFGIPSITMAKLFGTSAICVDSDQAKMKVGERLCSYLDVHIHWECADLFAFLRRNTVTLKDAVLLVTAAYCRDQEHEKPMGSGERDIVCFAKTHHMDIALLPFRTGDILSTGISSESKRIAEYEDILTGAGYHVSRHSTAPLFRGRGAPEWFFIDLLMARSRR